MLLSFLDIGKFQKERFNIFPNSEHMVFTFMFTLVCKGTEKVLRSLQMWSPIFCFQKSNFAELHISKCRKLGRWYLKKFALGRYGLLYNAVDVQ